MNPKRDGNAGTHKIGKNSGSIKSTGSAELEDNGENSDLFSYETKIIGGVPVRTVKVR